MNRKTMIVAGSLLVVAICLFLVYRTATAESGPDQANVSKAAKSIDDTKGNTPSVSPEKLKLGVGGGKRPIGL